MTAGCGNSRLCLKKSQIHPCAGGTRHRLSRPWAEGQSTIGPPAGLGPRSRNWIIHKQIWAIEHPEQFYPAINSQWQDERLKEEGKK